MPECCHRQDKRVVITCQMKERSSADFLLWVRHICGTSDADTITPAEKPIRFTKASIPPALLAVAARCAFLPPPSVWGN